MLFRVLYIIITSSTLISCKTRVNRLSLSELTSFPEGYKLDKIEAYYINLDPKKGDTAVQQKSIGRDKKMKDFFEEFTVDTYERFEAVYGAELNKKTDPNGRTFVELNKENIPIKTSLSNGELGNYLSHYLLWKKISKKKESSLYFVTEDDISKLDDYFNNRFKSMIAHAPNDWDLLFLYCFQSYSFGCHATKENITTNKRFIKLEKKCTPGTVTYLIKPKAAARLARHAIPISNATDRFIGDLMPGKKLNMYCAFPEIVKTVVYGDSIIDDMGGRN